MTPLDYKPMRSENVAEPRPSDIFTAGYLRHLDFCVDVGLVGRAQKVMEILSRYDLKSLPELAKILRRAADWLPGALQFEGIHGSGSLLNVKHPKYIKTAERPAVRLASRKEAAAH